MEDLLLSQKQYRALLSRLDEINDDVTSIKIKTRSEARYIDNTDLLKILHVTNRTIQRWRKSGKLPYIKIGNRFYYRVDLVLACFKLRDEDQLEFEYPIDENPKSIEKTVPIICEYCPLFWLFNKGD